MSSIPESALKRYGEEFERSMSDLRASGALCGGPLSDQAGTEPHPTKPRPMTGEEKLQLAGEIRQLVESRFPWGRYYGQGEVLFMALLAITNLDHVKHLFFGGRK